MNIFGHLVISPGCLSFALGNMLCDAVRSRPGTEVADMFLRGMECHRSIDRFTDTHRDVRKMVALLDPFHRQYGRVIVDVLLDYFLWNHWNALFPGTPDRVVRQLWQSYERYGEVLPEQAESFLSILHRHDVLERSGTVSGVEQALLRLQRRAHPRRRKYIAPDRAVRILHEERDALGKYSLSFFTELHHLMCQKYDMELFASGDQPFCVSPDNTACHGQPRGRDTHCTLVHLGGSQP